MNSLPFISHHLFAKAAGTDPLQREQACAQAGNPDGADAAKAVPLELLDPSCALPHGAAPLRAASHPGRH